MSKQRFSPEELEHEYQAFKKATLVAPPASVSEQIKSKVHADLNPSPWLIFAKAALIHAFIGTLSLLFCPQFGISPLGNHGLFMIYMNLGPHLCMMACGATFVAASSLAMGIFLNPEELRVLRKTELLQFSVLGLLSIGVFHFMGAEIVLGFSALWLVGMILGGLSGVELSWLFRTKIRALSLS